MNGNERKIKLIRLHWIYPDHKMESLPDDIILEILQYMTATDCYRLIQTSTQFAWLRDVRYVWRRWAQQNYSSKEFDEIYGFSPAQVYRRIAECKHTIMIESPCRQKLCGRRSVHKTSFCQQHYCNYGIRMCDWCGSAYSLNVDRQYCRQCLNNKVYLDGCLYDAAQYRTNGRSGRPCGQRRLPGSLYCHDHDWCNLPPEPIRIPPLDIRSDSPIRFHYIPPLEIQSNLRPLH